MKFLLDVHIATSIGRKLADAGHDVIRASDAHADWSDRQLLDLAVGEHRILITEDRDFSDLVYRHDATPPPAIVYLRLDAADQANVTDRLLLVLANARAEGHMIVIQRTNIRYRPLPKKIDDDG